MRRFIYTLLVIISMISFVVPSANASASITRSQVEQRALAMINYSWSYSSSRNSSVDPAYANDITKPTQLNTYAQTGIPYCWGGFDSQYTASYGQSWTNFGDSVQKGAYTGNTNSDGGIGHVPGTSGLDCSGFVQAAFNIPGYKLSTVSIMDYFTIIKLNDLKHMDILDYPGEHMLIFDSWGTYNGVYGAYTYESTDDVTYGGIQGTKRYFIDMDTINTGYVAARYNNIQDDFPYPVNTGIFAKAVNNVNLRTSATTASGISAVIPQNGIVYISGYDSGWYKVVYNGLTGWVYGSYVGYLPSGKYVTVKEVTNLNIRSSATSTAPVVGTLGVNQYAEVLGQSGNWMQIKINNITGWSYAPYLSYIY